MATVTTRDIINYRLDEQKERMHNPNKVLDNALKMYDCLSEIKDLRFYDARFGVSGDCGQFIFVSLCYEYEGESPLIDRERNNLYKITFNYGFNSIMNNIVFAAIKYYQLNMNSVASMYTFQEFSCGVKLNNGYINQKNRKLDIKDGVEGVIRNIEEIKTKIRGDLEELKITFGDVSCLNDELQKMNDEARKYQEMVNETYKKIAETRQKQEKMYNRKMEMLRDF
jgi:hypothetical protein